MVEAMIAHVVLMKPRPDLSDVDRNAFAASFERAVQEIPSVRGVRLGRRVLHGAGYEGGHASMEYVAVIDFDNLRGLREYLQHPLHADLGERFSTSLASAAVYDFETGGLEMIPAWLTPQRMP
jgi:hypothetical protein